MEKLLERIEALEKRTNIMTFVRNGEICFMGKGLSEKKDLQVKIDKLETEKRELVEALMRIAFEVPCCAKEEAREVLAKIKSERE